MHARDGIVVVHGPGVARGRALAPASVLDVAPTVLALAGLPVPEGLDGRPLSVLAAAHPGR
jgi:arylsulfatase A-like enzyme